MLTLGQLELLILGILADTIKDTFGLSKQDATPILERQAFRIIDFLDSHNLINRNEVNNYDGY